MVSIRSGPSTVTIRSVSGNFSVYEAKRHGLVALGVIDAAESIGDISCDRKSEVGPLR